MSTRVRFEMQVRYRAVGRLTEATIPRILAKYLVTRRPRVSRDAILPGKMKSSVWVALCHQLTFCPPLWWDPSKSLQISYLKTDLWLTRVNLPSNLGSRQLLIRTSLQRPWPTIWMSQRPPAVKTCKSSTKISISSCSRIRGLRRRSEIWMINSPTSRIRG